MTPKIHKRLRLSHGLYLKDIGVLGRHANNIRLPYIRNKTISLQDKKDMGYMVAQLEYHGLRIDFYITLHDLYVVGFDPNPLSDSGTRYHLETELSSPLKEGLSCIPLGRSTGIFKLSEEENLNLSENTKIHDFTMSTDGSYPDLGLTGSYADSKHVNIGKIGSDFAILKQALNGYNKPSSEFHLAFGTMAMIISESIRFYSISRYFNKQLACEDKIEYTTIKEILTTVNNWSTGTKGENPDIRVPCFLKEKEDKKLKEEHYKKITKLLEKENKEIKERRTRAKRRFKNIVKLNTTPKKLAP
ncbi:ribosome-inactivating family protein [Microbulbifer sp. EKSA005]|uniref:ribosome-inactivating family protein n=1 Tax=Microbulbifer sp. EKSA005 TaxID=3243364 RepID=UPI0040437369